MAEQRTLNPQVLGSNPRGRTIQDRHKPAQPPPDGHHGPRCGPSRSSSCTGAGPTDQRSRSSNRHARSRLGSPHARATSTVLLDDVHSIGRYVCRQRASFPPSRPDRWNPRPAHCSRHPLNSPALRQVRGFTDPAPGGTALIAPCPLTDPATSRRRAGPTRWPRLHKRRRVVPAIRSARGSTGRR